jgi:sugar-specific transcriptional regulator TrmB
MRDNDDNIQILIDLGVNRTQARIYLALVEKGTSTIRKVADYSGVGRPDTYRAMLELKHAGLIETILCSPTKYKPLPLAEAISLLIDQKQNQMTALMEKTDKLIQEYERKPASDGNDYDSQFVLVPEGVTSVKKAIAAIRNAEKNIELVCSFKRFNQTLVAASEDIIKAANRGVKVRFILDKTNIGGPLSKVFVDFCRTSLCEIRYMPELMHSFIAIYDKKEVHLATKEEDDFSQAPILWSNNPELVSVMQNYFEAVWLSQSSVWENSEEQTQILKQP